MLLFLIATAFADVAPEPGYVETCTIPIQCGEIEGKVCSGARNQDPPEPECDALVAKGWTRMCTGWGGTMYDVVMCEEAPDPAAVAERVAAAESGGCGPCATAGFGAPVVALLLLPFLVRRRSARDRDAQTGADDASV